jgi:hypothetical protein
MVSRGPEQQVPARLRGPGEARKVLRQHQNHEKCPRLAVLRRESQVLGDRDGGRGWRCLPGAASRQRKYTAYISYKERKEPE